MIVRGSSPDCYDMNYWARSLVWPRPVNRLEPLWSYCSSNQSNSVFSHNKPAETMFFSQVSDQRTGPMSAVCSINSDNFVFFFIVHIECSSVFNGTLKCEWGVRPPGSSNAAMPDDATVNVYFPWLLMLFSRVFHRNVFPVPPYT